MPHPLPVSDVQLLSIQVEQQLAAIRKAVRRPLEAEFAKGHLTGPQQSLMEVVVRSSAGLTLKEVAAQLGLAHSTVSVMATRLAGRGLLLRTEHPGDGRATLLVASHGVREFLDRTMPKLLRTPIASALAKATPAERREILSGLDRLRRLLESEHAGR